ncbi:glycerol-3-phosphate dehydrogenase/oxidase [Gangjinia marincola]|uniref:Glycerol-3-phosphate dehydrogenase/oxidase n=1 Tax=Gangjinia marincola TaxID=578463 RepID=A0ABN1MI51_9FLAO
MNRENELTRLENTTQFDVLIIGGGATGLGSAVDAASRGLKTALLEAVDFAKGTSSRSTKLVHGGVRYLAQGDVKMVAEALKERGLLAKNAEHLFMNQTFLIPSYAWWQEYYYGFGMKVYDVLARKLSLGASRRISKEETLARIPMLEQQGLTGSVTYKDGQFDDARLAVNLAQTAHQQGAVVLNHIRVTGLLKDDQDTILGVKAEDQETKKIYEINAKVVINATGVFSNKILKMNKADDDVKVVPSQGVHLVLDKSFLQSDEALMIPKTSDGRVLFAIPWHDKVVVGTTDTPIKKPRLEPEALEQEIDFILENAQQYLAKKPTREDVLSVFAGLRPLVKPSGKNQSSKEISRGHKIIASSSGLISVIGGKWTTYRHMGEEVINKAIASARLTYSASKTETLPIYGNYEGAAFDAKDVLSVYGSDALSIHKLMKDNPAYAEKIHPDYDYTIAQVIWGIRYEMARTVEDILARRIRLLFLDAKAAIQAAPVVAETMKQQLNSTEAWKQERLNNFYKVAHKYILQPKSNHEQTLPSVA